MNDAERSETSVGNGDPAFVAMLLADGRFPAGGHVHSAGVESAVADGRVVDVHTLEEFVVGRLWTVGLTEAALTAATVAHLTTSPTTAQNWSVRGCSATTEGPISAAIAGLDREAGARVPVASLRSASRRLGRQMCRVAARCWDHPILDEAAGVHPDGPHAPIALGAVAVATGLTAHDAARLSLHHAITTPAQAGLRLLGLDPFAVASVTARLASVAEAVTHEAVAAGCGPLADLPARTGPVLDLAAVEHRTWDVRLFAT